VYRLKLYSIIVAYNQVDIELMQFDVNFRLFCVISIKKLQVYLHFWRLTHIFFMHSGWK